MRRSFSVERISAVLSLSLSSLSLSSHVAEQTLSITVLLSYIFRSKVESPEIICNI
jgi:hypothetical protein